MKKLSILILLIIFLCASCSDLVPQITGTRTPSRGDATTSATNDIEEQEEQDEPTEDAAIPERPLSAKEEALLLYLEYINAANWDDSYMTMSLAYIDDDDIPELVVDGRIAIDGILICTVSNGNVETVFAEGSGGGITYIERGNAFTFIEIKKDLYIDVVCSIENGKFVRLHEGMRDYSNNSDYWDGKAVSSSDYYEKFSAAFDYSKSSYSGMESFWAADMIHELNTMLYGPSWNQSLIMNDPVTGLLTSDGAWAVYDSWLANHPDYTEISRQSEEYEYRGELYYLFPAKSTIMYHYNILVHMKTGELLFKLITDGMNPITLIEPLDNWYSRYGESSNTKPTLDIIDYSLPEDQSVGDIFGVRGIIESSTTILSVTVEIYNDKGVVETGSSAFPRTNTYDLRKLDYDILFDILTPGGKTYVIEAVDEMGAFTLTSWFFVS